MDFTFTNHGSVGILAPLTPAAEAWLEEHISEDAMRWGGGVAIQSRYAPDILEGIEADGLGVR